MLPRLKVRKINILIQYRNNPRPLLKTKESHYLDLFSVFERGKVRKINNSFDINTSETTVILVKMK